MITFITGNKHKVIEAENIFKNYNIELEHIDLGYMEPQGTLEEVALFGAKYASRELGKSVIVEDAGLFINGLNGFPGTYSHYVQDTLGNKGILKLMEDVDDRTAEFRSVIGFCTPNSEPKIFLGKVDGLISTEERGNLGFAFDPIFYVESEGKTFGELTTEEKNEFSHRRNSLTKFIQWYSSEFDE
ncbi:MAG: XTP/dITP diphosphatase [Methanobrevibacter boviskoreani]|uniref:XTP/dITP diphosphatase n=1 Tax=Methanobrevibacter boviskoreani TaxID=1348249 RepID=UPI0023A8D26F|nr:XTP/dITP diphosphatase [Methanobrevibacter boviskoreani]MCI6774207.1 XTP/dITP diphosphatase [Methanobrevibacter boviskoreani]MCI6930772.1 XTP/dITP diphosphatase [Methanobrevibacter boviskoreani]MDY5613698.1 XTP/dITP diphosphatase [Methanobrevibacter boviskoreani]